MSRARRVQAFYTPGGSGYGFAVHVQDLKALGSPLSPDAIFRDTRINKHCLVCNRWFTDGEKHASTVHGPLNERRRAERKGLRT